MALPQHTSSTLRTRGDMVLVWRDHSSLQIGIDDDALVLRPVPPLTDALLISLLQPGQGMAQNRSSDSGWPQWLISQLDQHDRLAEPAADVPIRIVGTGRIAEILASALLDLGHSILVKDPSQAAGTRPNDAARLVGHLRRDPSRLTSQVSIDSGRHGTNVAVTIVCTGMCEPDRSMTDALTREGMPYLVLRTRPGTAVAGPLVVPQETSCMRCADLWRTEADPVWPRLAAQLAHQLAPTNPVLDTWVAALGLAQITAFLYGENGELRSRTLTLSSDTGRTTMRNWPLHPKCSCYTTSRELEDLSQVDTMGQ